ncbi:MAG TPA: hypothetical protein VNJ07_10685 [Chitinophagales bacterium]|nr:hypothetical protein [Chitinophagales bacterium]
MAQHSGEKSSPEISVKTIAGKWLVTDATINMLAEVDDTLKLTKKNCFWADHLAKGVPVAIDNQGNVSYESFGQPASARVKIENGSLVFLFTGVAASENGEPVQAESYTTYNLQLSGNQMTISRKDGMVAEKYIFKRQ